MFQMLMLSPQALHSRISHMQFTVIKGQIYHFLVTKVDFSFQRQQPPIFIR